MKDKAISVKVGAADNNLARGVHILHELSYSFINVSASKNERYIKGGSSGFLLKSSGWSSLSVIRYHTVIHQALKYTMKTDLAAQNVAIKKGRPLKEK